MEAVSTALQPQPVSKKRQSVWDWAKSMLKRERNALPPGFNADAYLFHNPDVAFAGVDPATHYISNGRVEQRRYRYS
jgi:hypothetical protein